MLNDRASDGIDPLLLLLIAVCDEVHGLSARRKLEGKWFVEDVFGSLDSQAGTDRNNAARIRIPCDVILFEPEELSLLQNKPPAPPCFDVLTLLHQPSRTLRAVPEVDAVVIVALHSPKARHFAGMDMNRSVMMNEE